MNTHHPRYCILILILLTSYASGFAAEKPEPTDVTMEQRTTKAVPGTDGLLNITIGDITAGQVHVTVYAIVNRGTKEEKRELLVPETSMSLYRTVTFQYGGAKRELALIKLVNVPIGPDYATFRYSIVPDAEKKKPSDKPLPPTITT